MINKVTPIIPRQGVPCKLPRKQQEDAMRDAFKLEPDKVLGKLPYSNEEEDVYIVRVRNNGGVDAAQLLEHGYTHPTDMRFLLIRILSKI